MNKPQEQVRSFSNFQSKLLRRTGGWYLFIAILFTQLISSLGAFAADYTIQINAEFSPAELISLIRFASIGLLLTNGIVLLGAYLYYGDVRKELDTILHEKTESTSTDLAIWNKATSLSWHYSAFLFILSIFTIITPVLLFLASAGATIDQIIYTFLGGFAGVLGTAVLSLLLLDHLLVPVYGVLQQQYEGVQSEKLIKTRGLNLSLKLQSVILAIILISILLTAPIGYHQTVRALETGEAATLQEMQIQSLVVAISSILFGILLSYLFAQSVSAPLQELVKTFGKIETGNMGERATLKSSDEAGELTIYFNRMVAQLDELQDSLEAQIQQRTEQLRVTSEVGRVVSSILDPNKLIEEVVNLITERLGYYYAAIFLLSPDGYWAELKNATGEAGKTLMERQHRLSVGGKSMVGSAINLREARIAHDVGVEAVRFDNPLLPETRSEIALPLIVGGNVLGALDAQSTKENAFDEEVVETLQAMANQVAVALENARLFQETQEALMEIQTTQRRQLSEAWSEALTTKEYLEYAVGEKSEGEQAGVSIPLSLREQIIGEINLEGGSDWVTEDQDWIEAVATQAALALENARLLEESQQVALQERLAAEITSKIWASSTTEEILQVALRELGSALGASEASIELSADDKEEDAG